MIRLILPILALGSLQAQIVVETVAGGKIRSGVPIQDVLLGVVSGASWGPGESVVFADSAHDIIRRIRHDGIVETIAGTGVTGHAGDGGQAIDALLHGPGLLQYDAAENLYFVDRQNWRIRRIDTHGVITTIVGDGIRYSAGMDLEGPALLRSIDPRGLAVDRTGIVYFSDTSNNVIRRVTRNGQLEIVAGVYDPACADCSDGSGGQAKNAHLNHPGVLTVDDAGNLYVAEGPSSNNVIRRIAPNGIITNFAGLGPFPGLRAPLPDGVPALGEYVGDVSGLAADGVGNVYVASNGQIARVRRIDSNGIIHTIFNGTNGGLAADASGDLLVFSPLEIQQLAPDGTITPLAPGNPKTAPDGTVARDAWLLSPGPIAVNRSGDLYVYELQSCLIRKVGTNGILTTIAGTGKCAPMLPLTPDQALPDLSFPSSMTFDSQDRLWVASGRIFLIIAPDGSIASQLQPRNFGTSTKMAFDAKGRLYLMNMFSLIRLIPDGSVETIVSQPSNPGFPPFSSPGLLSGLGVDPAKNVYFKSDVDQSIYRMSDDGSYSVVYKNVLSSGVAMDATGTAWGGTSFTNASGSFSLGRLDAGYSGDGGPAQSARFYPPGPVTFAPNGDLYFVDGDRIRKLTGIQPQIPPVISPGGIVNSASYNGGAISPGELISIFGSNFGTSGLDIAPYENNTVPSQLGRTKVLFDDQLGEIVAVAPNLINVLVPYSVAVGGIAQVRVQVDATVSQAVAMPVVATIPDLYTTDESGSGPGIILNQDGSFNSTAHPAARGSVVALYGTGEGVLSPQLPQGALAISTPYPIMTTKPAVTVAGQPAEVRYSGAAPYFPLGVFEIDVRIPASIASGPAPISVTIGDRSTTRMVTVAVQ